MPMMVQSAQEGSICRLGLAAKVGTEHFHPRARRDEARRGENGGRSFSLTLLATHHLRRQLLSSTSSIYTSHSNRRTYISQ